jgi:diphthamide biosynthesis protein 3
MGAYDDEIEIEDMAWDETKGVYHYPCPCGDRFEISRRQLAKCEDIAMCPSCSLIIRVIYDVVRASLCAIGLAGCSDHMPFFYQLDFEDEAPDDEPESDSPGEDEEESEEEVYHDALEKLTISDSVEPAEVVVPA